MKTKLLPLFGVFIFINFQLLNAQVLSDAVRYSNTNFAGTARTAGVGNSFGAMGGDFGVLSINPAGIADFRKSDLSFSFSFNNIENESYINSDSDNKEIDQVSNRLFLENIGAVFVSNPGTNWVTSNFAIGLNQLGNLTEQIYFEGSSEGSITERFVELANATSFNNNIRDPNLLDDFEAGLAWETEAIFPRPNDDLEYSSDFLPSDVVPKSQSIGRSGRINEFSMAWAGNYQNKFGLGIAIGIPFISFEESKEYREIDRNNEIPIFESLIYSEDLTTSGVGVNFKIGVNTIIAKTARLGLAFHSPTWYSMDDQYLTSMRYNFTIGETQSIESTSPDGFFGYNYTSPMKLIMSAGGIIRSGDKLRGFFNADFEYKDYTQNSFDLGNDSSEREYERELENEIDDQLKAVFNIKLGAELAYDKFRVRGGVNLLGSPYERDNVNDVDNIYSAGLGFRGDQFYLDVAYVADRATNGYIPYVVLEDERNVVVTTDSKRNKILFTFGFKF